MTFVYVQSAHNGTWLFLAKGAPRYLLQEWESLVIPIFNVNCKTLQREKKKQEDFFNKF
jgi:hypothetical protein